MSVDTSADAVRCVAAGLIEEAKWTEVVAGVGEMLNALAAERDALRAERDKLTELLTSLPAGPEVAIRYTNWRGETRVRRVCPIKIWHGSTKWHPEFQWLMDALDAETGALRSFALNGFSVEAAARVALAPQEGA